MLKKLILIFIALFVVPVAFGAEITMFQNVVSPQKYMHVGYESEIIVPCYIDKALCDAGTSCTITIVGPGPDYVKAGTMTWDDNHMEFDHTANTTGIANAIVHCIDGADVGATDFQIEVNNVGKPRESLMPFVFGYGLLLLIFTLVGIVASKWMPSVGFPFFVFDLFILALLSITFHNNSITYAMVYETFYYIFITLGSIGFIVALVLAFRDIVQYMRGRTNKKRRDRY